VASLISLVLSPDSLIYAAFYFCIGRFYINSFLATLNARESIKGSVDDTTYMMMSLPSGGVNSSRMISESKQKGIAIRIDTTTEGMGDNSESPEGETENEKNSVIDLKSEKI